MNGSNPAFPKDHNGGHPGLTKREWFVGQALQGILAQGIGRWDSDPREVAVMAVRMADHALRELR